MKFRAACVVAGLLSLTVSLVPLTVAQTTAETASALPRLVRFSGTAKDLNGNPLTGVVGITFALYSEQTGGAALWLETQNVTADNNGRYVALLGSTKSHGLPTELFTTEQARWVGVQVSGQAEQPRVLLLSVPYALKAADAETLGGKPASAYTLNSAQTDTAPVSARSNPAAVTNASNSSKSAIASSISGGGTTDYVPLWTNNTTLGNSVIFQSTAGMLGIGTTSPLATLDIRKSTGVRAIASGNGIAIYGNATVASGTGKGVEGDTSSTSGTGVAGIANATTGSTQGMWGGSYSTSGIGVLGEAHATSGNTVGVEGTVFSSSGIGVQGEGNGIGVQGLSSSSTGRAGVFNNTGGGKVLSAQTKGTEVFSVGGNGVTQVGTQSATPGGILNVTSTSARYAGLTATGWPTQLNNSNPTPGIIATGGLGTNSNSDGAPGVVGTGGVGAHPFGDNSSGPGVAGFGGSGDIPGVGVIGTGGANGSGGGIGLVGNGGSGADTGGIGVYAFGQSAGGIIPDGDGLFATTADGGTITGAGAYAGHFMGDIDVTGAIFAGTKDFRIDHPIDPANKYLLHASVESSEMMNIYSGNATLDGRGEAIVQLPPWFEALNGDFRYQLTAIGAPGPGLYVAQKVSGNRFKIAGGSPGSEVSWQVTAVRQDAYARAHPLVVEQMKDVRERGSYIHPELYGAPEGKRVEWVRHPELLREIQKSLKRKQQQKTVSRLPKPQPTRTSSN